MRHCRACSVRNYAVHCLFHTSTPSTSRPTSLNINLNIGLYINNHLVRASNHLHMLSTCPTCGFLSLTDQEDGRYHDTASIVPHRPVPLSSIDHRRLQTDIVGLENDITLLDHQTSLFARISLGPPLSAEEEEITAGARPKVKQVINMVSARRDNR
ncbi:hypothetical protein EV421DRAFT_1109616 [Armillaria borealis]|uniref:Uncharacterized protein n=1 Tax=Armillaria borealis TaxID=47425 RepID=A0AA39J810_9AGAR|nr:hypothetical protein EV421DRAFT_1109616 [Armillaria borealis]